MSDITDCPSFVLEAVEDDDDFDEILAEVLAEFVKDVEKCKFIVGHNVSFDNIIVGCELLRKDMSNLLADFPALDTKDEVVPFLYI